MSLKEKGLHGIFWTFGQQFGTQIIQFIVQIILARVLVPEEFGIIGMLAVFMALGNSLVDSGNLVLLKKLRETCTCLS
jgi:O-antigen/teichoic acid export membrane protein